MKYKIKKESEFEKNLEIKVELGDLDDHRDEAIKKIEEIDDNNLEWHFIGRIQSNKIKKKVKGTDFQEPAFSPGLSYGGFFHMEYPGLKDRTIFGISGYGGNTMLIDMDNSKIVVTQSAATAWDQRTFILNVIRYGKLPK